MNILYCNIDKMIYKDIENYLRILPQLMRSEVTRFKYTKDQKSRLIARLMLNRV